MDYVSCHEQIKIPESVAVCPDCEGQITIEANAWTQEDNGEWVATSFDSVCVNEPDIEDSEAFAEWEELHHRSYDMPYVYWLPIDIKIENWLKANYRFTGLDK
jgi:hypothetical protein